MCVYPHLAHSLFYNMFWKFSVEPLTVSNTSHREMNCVYCDWIRSIYNTTKPANDQQWSGWDECSQPKRSYQINSWEHQIESDRSSHRIERWKQNINKKRKKSMHHSPLFIRSFFYGKFLDLLIWIRMMCTVLLGRSAVCMDMIFSTSYVKCMCAFFLRKPTNKKH